MKGSKTCCCSNTDFESICCIWGSKELEFSSLLCAHKLELLPVVQFLEQASTEFEVKGTAQADQQRTCAVVGATVGQVVRRDMGHFSLGRLSQRKSWIGERLKVSKVRERCKEMACPESLQRTVFIRELIWKEIECEIAARLSTLGTVALETQSALQRLAKSRPESCLQKSSRGMPRDHKLLSSGGTD